MGCSRLVFLVVAIAVLSAEALGQGETTSAIVAQATDATGAVVPGATVTATSHDTRSKRSAKTDEAGRFNFPQLKPGSYAVRIEAQGFEPQEADNVEYRRIKPEDFGIGRGPRVLFGHMQRGSGRQQLSEQYRLHDSECAPKCLQQYHSGRYQWDHPGQRRQRHVYRFVFVGKRDQQQPFDLNHEHLDYRSLDAEQVRQRYPNQRHGKRAVYKHRPQRRIDFFKCNHRELHLCRGLHESSRVRSRTAVQCWQCQLLGYVHRGR